MGEKDKLHFLIDYENVREAGLEGLEHLYDTDAITIFYSAACEKISKRSMDFILQSGCHFQAVRLKRTGKNALDFYIVSMIGALFGTGFAGKVVVVSKDKGYTAMKDYWMEQGIQSERILLKATVKDGILASNENSIRRRMISAGASQLSIGKEYAKYQERERLKKKIETLFAGTEYEDEVAKIFELTEAEKKPRDLYLGSLKRFGRTDGTKIYRFLKQANAA
ncbi:MAG: PIN domain-containing protein [Lachnospiraceae bacterium]|nr:PIN domain-containing protein [Lachnospiraceae bacterium]